MTGQISKQFVVLVAASAAAFFFSCSGPSEEPGESGKPKLLEKPHVVVIVLDTLRADAVGAYGGPNGVSPEIDALADEGVRFGRVIAPSNWTKPSWAAMLTGQLPRTLGVYKELGECLPDSAQTLSESFRSGGYRTFGATANPNINSSFNYDQGFDEYADSHVVWDWMAVTSPGETNQSSDEARLAPATELYAQAIEWAQNQGSAPCYIQICTMEMHEYHRGEYSLNRPEFNGLFADLASPEREYYRALRQSSYDMQQFILNLRSLPGWHDILLIVTSDHGEGLSSHPDVARSKHHGAVMYDSNLNVPWIMHRPGALPEGRVVREPVGLEDLAPTILEMAGLTAPTGIYGRSLMPVIDGQPKEAQFDYVVSESYLRDLDKIAITKGAWRYIENRDQANHDNAQRGQMNPEALQPVGAAQNGKATDQIEKLPAIADELRALLREWESTHPKAPASGCGSELTDEELEQLRAIGYVDVGEPPPPE